MKPSRIVVFSDSTIGFGSPEILALSDQLARRLDCTVHLIQPDELNRPIVDFNVSERVKFHRLFTELTTYTPAWRHEFARRAASLGDHIRPDIMVAVGPTGYAAASRMTRDIPCGIYYHLEMITHNEMNREFHEIMGGDLFHGFLVIEPERFLIDLEKLGWPLDNVHFERILPSAPVAYPDPMHALPADQRNGAFVYFGHLHWDETLVKRLVSQELNDHRIDFFGRVGGMSPEEMASRISASPNKSYHGLVQSQELVDLLPTYGFSIVSWDPALSAATYHLMSTKFCHSVIAGVPTISTPNPPNVYWTKKNDTGLLLAGTDARAFEKGFREARELYGTDRYRQMVDNCRRAAETDFNNALQLERICNFIEARHEVQQRKKKG